LFPSRRERCRRLTPLLALLMVLTVSACTLTVSGRAVPTPEITGTVGPEGGTVGSPSDPAQVVVPKDSVRQPTSVIIQSTGAAPPSTLSDIALPIGQPVNISVAAPLPGAAVRLPLDPAELSFEGRTATVTNAFIAVFNETFEVWVPLPTTFDPATGQLVAQAPHFSFFRQYVVNPLSRGWTATKTGTEAITSLALGSINGMWEGLTGGRKREADCTTAVPGWTVTSALEEVEGCVVAQGETLLGRIENGFRVPLTMAVPSGTDLDLGPPAEAGENVDIVSLLLRPVRETSGQTLIDARSSYDFGLPKGDQTRSSYTLEMEPDLLALTFGAILTTLNWIPGVKAFIEVI